MKILQFLLLICPFSLLAQSPLAFNYQGVARDDQGDFYANQEISLELSLVRNSDAGPVDFTEEQFVTTNEFGLFSVQIGNGDPVLGNLDALDWANNQYYISVGFDPQGGSNFEELGITQLLSVPYAMHARTASNGSDASADDQLLDLNDGVLSIENGNSVDLSMVGGASQTLAIDGTTLSISNGNSISLPATSSGSIWLKTGNQISYAGGTVTVEDFALRKDGNLFGALFIDSNGKGQFRLYGMSGNPSTTIGITSDSHGYVGVDDPATSQNIARMTGTTAKAGFLGTYGPNSNRNAVMTNLAANSNHGYIGVYDAADNEQVSIYVNANGQGVVSADITTTIAEHPARSDQHIVYAGLSGSEVGVYHRGWSELTDGRAVVKLPEHFRMVSDTSSYTITMTPYSVRSKGLAIVNKTESGFIVGELFEGQGNYRFDWEVKAVRKGYMDYPIIQEKQATGSIEKSENE